MTTRITSNPALDAYQRMAVSKVGGTRQPQKATAADGENGGAGSQQIAKVTISSEARQLAAGATQGSMNVQKVQRLKAEVDTKSIQFDSAKIAERLVAALG
ncbi:MAG: flagellar biosynthesis anti-sigma factor FlgM [Polyangiaceae bacterium]